ncbi:MAG: NAD(P)-dependent oxidoreductase [Acidimicrobiales bacterium]
MHDQGVLPDEPDQRLLRQVLVAEVGVEVTGVVGSVRHGSSRYLGHVSSSRTVGVVGLGAIGAGVAKGVAGAGHRLVVCDVRAEATAPFAEIGDVVSSPAEVGARCEVVLVAVVDDDQLRAVALGPDGALAAMAPGTSLVVLSTVSVTTLREVADAAGPCGVTVVDCGVTGGPSAAADGQLVSMVGGTPEAVDAVRDVLDGFSSLVVHMGPLGAGLRAKLARNVVQYGAWLAAYEGQRLAEAAGIDLAKLAQVIRASEKRTGGTTTLMFRPTVAPFGPDDDPGLVDAMRTGAALAHKDLRAAIDMARGLGTDTPLAELTEATADAIFGLGGPGDTGGAR